MLARILRRVQTIDGEEREREREKMDDQFGSNCAQNSSQRYDADVVRCRAYGDDDE